MYDSWINFCNYLVPIYKTRFIIMERFHYCQNLKEMLLLIIAVYSHSLLYSKCKDIGGVMDIGAKWILAV